jgi:hypothetical protein
MNGPGRISNNTVTRVDLCEAVYKKALTPIIMFRQA